MIQIICKSESYTYNAYHILKAFYPSQEVSCKTDEKASNYVMVHLPDDREISVGFENTVEITDTHILHFAETVNEIRFGGNDRDGIDRKSVV